MGADVFISYARTDRSFAATIAEALRASGIEFWWDAELLPGQAFDRQIRSVLQDVRVVLGLLSPQALQSKWVMHELTYAQQNGVVIVPVLVGGAQPQDLPPPLNQIQALVLDSTRPETSAQDIARQIDTLLQRLTTSSAPPSEEARRRLALAAAETARQVSGSPPAEKSIEPPSAIFVVHGRDHEMLGVMTDELTKLGIKPIVLKQERTSHDHLFAKFMAVAGQAQHAIVLISGDDVGALFEDYVHPAGGAARLEFRARQNVILELGYFYGKLGDERVFVFSKPPRDSDRIVKRFEIPSDLAGRDAMFDDFVGDWQGTLRERLRGAGFAVP
jgi:predicted nucleotide-binding protein